MLIFNQFHALLFKSNIDSVIVFFKMISWLNIDDLQNKILKVEYQDFSGKLNFRT